MKKNVLIVFTSLSDGGAQTQQLKILQKIDSSQYNFYICCLKNKGLLAEAYEKAGFSIYELNMKSRFEIYKLVKLYSVLKSKKIQVVYTKGSGDSFFWGRLIGWLAGADGIISSLHTTSSIRSDKDFFNPLNILLTKITDYFVFVTNAQTAIYKEYYNIPSSKIRLMHNGVELKKIGSGTKDNLKKELCINKKQKIIGIVATLESHKNHKMFLKAASIILQKYSDALFLIIGDGHLKEELINFSAELGIDAHVKFLGYKNNAIEYISLMNVLVLTSQTEAFPNCLVEGMSQGIPVVATNVGGVPEIIVEGENGYMIDPDDFETLSEKILEIIKNPMLENKMGKTSYEYCLNRFKIEGKAEYLCRILDSF